MTMRHVLRAALAMALVLPAALLAVETARVTPIGPAKAEWTFTGGGKAGEDGAFLQEGRAAMIVQADAGAENYLITGELLLPQVNSGVAVSVAAAGEAKPASVSIKVGPKGFQVGRQTLELENLPETWMAFSLNVLQGGGSFRLSVPGAAPIQLAPGAGARTVKLTLTRGAQVRRLDSRAFPAGSPLLTPAVLGPVCNVRLTDAKAATTSPATAPAAAALLAPGNVPAGPVVIDGVPFVFASAGANDALDVSKSPRTRWQRGGKELKEAYAGTAFKVANEQFCAVHVIAFSTARPGTVPRMTVRAGNDGQTDLWVSQVVDVPDLNANAAGKMGGEVVSAIPVNLADGKQGNLWHLRIPIPATGDFREYPELAIEFTRDIAPDVEHRGVQRVDPPSGAFVLAAAIERSPVTMSYESAEPGNIFHQGQQAVFPLELTNRADRAITGKVVAVCSGPGTVAESNALRREWSVEQSFTIQPGQSAKAPLDVAPKSLGWYSCKLSVQIDGAAVQSRQTSFAVLAPDTRQDVAESPFGVWCFWNAHASTRDENRAEKLAPIMNKGGWRWTYGGSPGGRGAAKSDEDVAGQIHDRYKITWTMGCPPYCKRAKPYGVLYEAEKFQADVVPWLEKTKQQRQRDNHYVVLHESRTSKALVVRYSEFLGGQPYVMPEAEQAKFDGQFEHVKNYCAAIRKADPNARIVLINDYPAMGNAYLSRHFPAELFDVLGSEGAMFAHLPEIQPDWLCLLGQLEQWRVMQKQHGYNKPVWFTEALYHPTGAEDMTDHEQALVYVREAMLALEGGVQRMAATGVLADCSDDYRKSGWGRAGFCYRDPEFNPKPSYAMYAWMTQVLDQARPDGLLETGSTVLHILRFRKADGQCVYPVWVVRGRQEVTLALASGQPTVYDAYGNVVKATFAPGIGHLIVQASDTPVYVTGVKIDRVAGRQVLDAPPPEGQPAMTFSEPAALQIVKEPAELLANVASTPEIQGAYRLAAEKVDGAPALRVELLPDQDTRKLLPRYVELKLAEPLTLPGERPWAIELRVRGNGGWGRIMFELTDAAGVVYTSVRGGTMGEPFVCFDGWQNMLIPLPGHYPAPCEKMRWPGTSDWQGGAAVTYPLKLTKVIVALRPEILYADTHKTPVPAIHLERLLVLPPPEGM